MKKIITFTIAILLSGCASMVWVHPRKGEGQFYQDLSRCQQMANISFPPQMVTMPIGSYNTQEATSCYRIGYMVQCNSTGTVNSPTPITVDRNQSTRESMTAGCLRGEGWRQEKKK